MTTFMATMEKQLSGPSTQHNSKTSAVPQPCTLFPVDPQAEERSQAIDRALAEDAKIRETQINVLPLGAFKMREIVKQLKNNDETGLTKDELIDYRYNTHQFVITCIETLVDITDVAEPKLRDEIKDCHSYLCDYIAVPHGDTPLDEETGRAVDALWKDPFIKEVFQASDESDLKKSSAYFFENISRVAASNYIPTEADILQSHKGIQGVSEHRFFVNGLSLNLIDVGTQRCERRKWIHQFDTIDAILYVVDLPCYDQEASGRNAMADQFELFASVVNSKWFANAKIVLFLNNVSDFRRKLTRSPFGDYFPDFSGDDVVDQAGEFLLRRFGQVNRSKRRLYTHLVDPNVASNIELLGAAISDDSH